MDKPEDVERLFSWLKAPMVAYREFAPRAEVAEAVATWPLVHRAAVQAGVAADDEQAPHGDSAIKERMARERASMPPIVEQAIRETPLPGTESFPTPSPSPGRLEDRPADAALAPSPAQHPAASYAERAPEAPHEATARPMAEPRRPVTSASDEARPAQSEQPRVAPRQAQYYQDGGRGALFGGEYREREPAPRGRQADRQDRSLDAVFTRLSGGRDRLPDPRDRARTTPGLGSVFGRLR